MAWNLGGEVTKCDHREYGSANITINKFGNGSADALFSGFGEEMKVNLVLIPVSHAAFSMGNDLGLDVPWRSTVQASSRLPCHWTHPDCPICCARAQPQALVRNPVSSGGDTFSQWQGSYRTLYPGHLRMQTKLDDGNYRIGAPVVFMYAHVLILIRKNLSVRRLPGFARSVGQQDALLAL